MEEEKAAAYYDELSRKGGGAARFKQGLGFSAAPSSNDAVSSLGSALPSASSFLSSFVRASSPSKNPDLDKKVQLQSIQNKLKKKPIEEDSVISSSRVSRDRESVKYSHGRNPSRDSHSHRRSRSRSIERHSKRPNRSKYSGRDKHSRCRSRSEDRGRDRHSRRRSRSRSSEDRGRDRHSRRRSRSRSRSRTRDDYSSNRRYRSRSTSRDRGRERSKRRSSSVSDEEKVSRKNRALLPRDPISQKRYNTGKARNSGVDYATAIEGYDKMTPAERVKAKMKLQLSETAERDEANGMGSGWERFDFDKDAPLDDEEIEAAEDDAALVKHIGQTFRFSTMEARREEQIKAAHDEAIFGTSRPSSHTETVFGASSHPPSTDETETKNVKTSSPKSGALTNLISDKVMAMQQVSWRDRARRS